MGVGLLVGGVVVAEAALYLWWRGRQDRRAPGVAGHAGLLVAPGGGVLTYEGRFR
jgi:hypothetical protein